MANSTRFSMALQMLALIALERPNAVTSERLAAQVGANPAAARRLLAMLARAGLAEGHLGKGGGATLARAPKKISLLDIYRAVEPGELVTRRAPAEGGAPALAAAFDAAVAPAEKAFFKSLGETTLKAFLKDVKAAA
ncbi:MAG TPA: Rrf2 family transcriptional regulator [Amphiplicatus sp.]|nr:Rrf2 family transcriptional regulator [Amphiplicatus sp.]HRX40921.1 Rrf2 family transcriptional regulator [Parvularculaceae bacterium]